LAGRQALKLLFKANKRLNTAYLLKEAFDQLWDYETEGWAGLALTLDKLGKLG
jgi:transposase